MTLLFIILALATVGVTVYLIMKKRESKTERPIITPPPIRPPQDGSATR